MLGRRRRVAGQAINHCSISADRLAWPDVVARNYCPFPYIAGDMQRTGMVIDVVDTDRFVVLVLQSVCICRRGWTMTAKQNGL